MSIASWWYDHPLPKRLHSQYRLPDKIYAFPSLAYSSSASDQEIVKILLSYINAAFYRTGVGYGERIHGCFLFLKLDSLDGTLFIHSKYMFLNSPHSTGTSIFVDTELFSKNALQRVDANAFIDIMLALDHRYILYLGHSRLTWSDDLTMTASWSLMPAMVEQCDISETLFVRNISKMFLPLVGNLTTWVKPCSKVKLMSISHRLIGYELLVTQNDSQSIFGRFMSPANHIGISE